MIGQCAGRTRIDLERLFDQLKRVKAATLLHAHDTKKVQRIKTGGLARQDFPIELLRVGEPSLLM